MPLSREKALDDIRRNIGSHGLHIYFILSSTIPRFSYSIGLYEKHGVELMLPGGFYYSSDEVAKIFNGIAAMAAEDGLISGQVFSVDGLGTFELGPVDPSWSREMILGAYDYYDRDSIDALQIKPDGGHWTLDVPDLARPWSPTVEPVWQWLHEPWTYPVPPDSDAFTNLAALRGGCVTHAIRTEENEWDLFAGFGADLPKEEVRIVPVGTLVAVDPSMEAVLAISVGEGLVRDSKDDEWEPWD